MRCSFNVKCSFSFASFFLKHRFRNLCSILLEYFFLIIFGSGVGFQRGSFLEGSFVSLREEERDCGNGVVVEAFSRFWRD